MSDRLAGRVALITGAASGMGLETVRLFVAEGARVIAADIDEAAGEAALGELGSAVCFVRCDVTRATDLEEAVAAAERAFGGLDILFNNAGWHGPEVGIADISCDAWHQVMAINLVGPMLGIRYAIPAMRRRGGGSIVSTVSIAALESGWGPIAYSTAKAGLLQLTRCAAAELAGHGIRVNAICPGVVATGIFAKYLGLSGEAAEKVREIVIARGSNLQPLRRTGLPEDVARACLFLSSDDSRFITGTHIVVDGGITVGPRHAWDATTPPPTASMGFTPEYVARLRETAAP